MSVGAPGLTLGELARELPVAVRVDGEAFVRGVQQDSRRVEGGDLFVALAGAHEHGGRFVADALARGAAAVLCDSNTPVPIGVPTVRTEDVRDALAFAAAAVYGHPSFSLEVIGLTGTNGKTTTSHLVRAAIDGALGAARCGIIGTVGHSYGDLVVDATHTTPEPDELTRILAAMRDRGASHVAMEVSSIALATARVRAIHFRVAAFTNLTQDHLDFHGTMERYAAAKASLFEQCGAAVVHVDDAFGRVIAGRITAPLIRVGTRLRGGEPADIAPVSLVLSERGIDAVLRTPRGDVGVRSTLLGAHNVENLAVALGIAHALDLDLERAAAALSKEKGAPGRLERCEEPEDDVAVLVDYAHTPDALARALDAVRPFTTGRLICVFGCGGDRDRTKRAPMGRAAAERADLVVVTSDNPRGEDPTAIAAAVFEGVRAAGVPEINGDLRAASRGAAQLLDRATAIAAAIHAAREGDVVIIAGKGHESYQIVGAERRPFDDREHARAALAQRRTFGRG